MPDPNTPITERTARLVEVEGRDQEVRTRVVGEEVLRRLALLEELGTDHPTAQRLRDLGAYVQGRGIYRNRSRTEDVCPPHGLTQAIRIHHEQDDNDIDGDGVIHRYPCSKQITQDVRDIAATKNAERLSVPVFVITDSEVDEKRRRVRLATVAAHDDAEGYFALFFGDAGRAPARPQVRRAKLGDFVLERKPAVRQSRTGRRVQRSAFRERRLDYYGEARCAVGDLAAPEALDAAHLRDKVVGVNGLCGSDHPRNGLILCANHHRVLDRGLLGIEPQSLTLVFTPPHGAGSLRVTRKDLTHLRSQPHPTALEHAWRVYLLKRVPRTTE